ncbi:cytochrome bc complex cytochrome b subunit [bacterium]|nr:cytochrome bc complex cytochrome b subunit [bacterium]
MSYQNQTKMITKKLIDNKPKKPSGIKDLIRWFTARGFHEDVLEQRLGISNLDESFKKSLEPKKKLHIGTMFGWITLFLFICEVITGILLMLYYRPTVAEAYANVRYITNNIHFGWLIRGIHFWGSHLMILFVFIHMIQTFIFGAYKPPRELTWISGVVLLILTLLFGLTGYLLPWNQISYWATTIVTEVPAVIPGIGNYLKLIARGGEDVSQVTLSRFYALHVVVVPMLVSILIFFHMFTIRKYLMPKDIIKHVVVLLFIFGLLLSLATLFPAPIHTKADPFNTPVNVKPEWYFLASCAILAVTGKFEFLGGWAPKVLGVVIQIVIISLLFLVPFLDTSRIRSPKKRPLSIAIGTLTIIGFIILTFLGKYI